MAPEVEPLSVRQVGSRRAFLMNRQCEVIEPRRKALLFLGSSRVKHDGTQAGADAWLESLGEANVYEKLFTISS